MNRKFFPAAILTALTSILPLPALAAPEVSELEQHRGLVSALQLVGVNTKLNPEGVCDPEEEISGTYISSKSTLIVCQDNGVAGKVTHWTANDFDTLRHEAMHVVQDCVDGGIGDDELSTFFTLDKLIEMMRKSSIPMERFKRLWEIYEEDGYSKEVIVLEMEAFMVAADVNAKTIADTVVKVCEAPDTLGF